MLNGYQSTKVRKLTATHTQGIKSTWTFRAEISMKKDLILSTMENSIVTQPQSPTATHASQFQTILLEEKPFTTWELCGATTKVRYNSTWWPSATSKSPCPSSCSQLSCLQQRNPGCKMSPSTTQNTRRRSIDITNTYSVDVTNNYGKNKIR